MQHMRFEKDFDLPPDRVFGFLAEHENLGPIFGAEVTRVCDGSDGTRNGVGSVRRLKPPGPVPAFEETVTTCEPNELIVYKVSRGTPLNYHHGEIHFSPNGPGTRVEWTIDIGTRLPGLDFVIARVLKMKVGGGLARLAIPA